MKTTIKKMEKMGLSDAIIKYVLGISQLEYSKLKATNYQLYIPNITEIISKYGNMEDVDLTEQKIELYNKIYEINYKPIPKISNEKKISVIDYIPTFEKALEQQMIESKIKQLKEQKKKIDEEIQKLRGNSITTEIVTQEEYDDTTDDITTLIEHKHYGYMSSTYNIRSKSLSLAIRQNFHKELYDNIEIGTIFYIYKDGVRLKVQVTEKGAYHKGKTKVLKVKRI